MNESVSPASSPAAVAPLDRAMQVKPAGTLRDTFVGAGRDYGPLRIYGGHLLAQGLAAAFATVAGDRLAHSLHGYFLKTGQPSAPIGYQVERLRDGRSYATRVVRAVQEDATLMLLTASFKATEPGDRHQPVMPESPSPEALLAARRLRQEPPVAPPFADPWGVRLEPADGWHPGKPPGGDPALRLWMRAALSAGADARARQCVLAYLSDGPLMFNALKPHGTAFVTHRATSLDHSLWFHRDADLEDWLLFDQQGPVAGDGRGLNRGHVFDRDGNLVVSVAQEAMMRPL